MITVTDEELMIFNVFRKAYPGEKRGNNTEFQDFAKKHKDWRKVLPTLSRCLAKQKEIREKKRLNGEWQRNWQLLKTYLNQRGWEIGNDEEDDGNQRNNRPVTPPKSPEQLHTEMIAKRRHEEELYFKACKKHKYTEEELNEPFNSENNTKEMTQDELFIEKHTQEQPNT